MITGILKRETFPLYFYRDAYVSFLYYEFWVGIESLIDYTAGAADKSFRGAVSS